MDDTVLIIKAIDSQDDYKTRSFTIQNPKSNLTAGVARTFLGSYDSVYGSVHELKEMYYEQRVRTQIYPEP